MINYDNLVVLNNELKKYSQVPSYTLAAVKENMVYFKHNIHSCSVLDLIKAISERKVSITNISLLRGTIDSYNSKELKDLKKNPECLVENLLATTTNDIYRTTEFKTLDNANKVKSLIKTSLYVGFLLNIYINKKLDSIIKTGEYNIRWDCFFGSSQHYLMLTCCWCDFGKDDTLMMVGLAHYDNLGWYLKVSTSGNTEKVIKLLELSDYDYKDLTEGISQDKIPQFIKTLKQLLKPYYKTDEELYTAIYKLHKINFKEGILHD